MECLIKSNGIDPIKLEIEVTFMDSVPREILDIDNYAKSPQWKSLINRMKGYHCIKHSLNETREAIAKYFELKAEDRPRIIGRSLWNHAVVQYSKCYQSNDGWTVKLEPSATIKNEPQIIKDGHRWFISERHTFIAHGGESLSQQSFALMVEQKQPPKQIDAFFIQLLTAATPMDEAVKNLDILAEVAIKYVDQKTIDIEKNILTFFLKEGRVVNPELLAKHGLGTK